MTKICSAIARQQAASDRIEKPRPAVAFSLFPAVPKTWEHQNEKARMIETDRAGRGAKRVLWSR
jgi:hypothetical protein